MRNKIWIALVLALVLVFNSCEKDMIRVAGITLNTTSMNLNVGASADLVATVSPVDAENPKIIWSSEDVSVVEVNNGKLLAVAPGTTNVVAKADDNPEISAVCKVTVKYLADKLTIESAAGPVTETLTINKEESIRLKASIQPEDSAVKKVSWISTNKDVLAISQIGEQEVEIKGVKTGETDIMVAAAGVGLYATCHIVVVQNAQGLSIEPAKVELYEDGEPVQLTAVVTPADTSDPVIWTSSDEKIATVSAEGKITAIKAGAATITASVGSGENTRTATCPVTVKCHVKGVKFENPALTLKKGETKQLTATVYPDRASDKKVIWKSDNESVATVSETGLLTAKTSGTAKITVTAAENSSAKDECVVTVISNVTDLTLDHSKKDLRVGETFQLTATVSPADATDKTIIWSSSNESVATVDGGKVTAVAPGKAEIRARVKTEAGELEAHCTVQVSSRVDGITLSEREITLLTTDTHTLTAEVTPKDTNYTLIWKSDNGDVATVAASGKTTCKVTPVGRGNTTIHVSTEDGFVAESTVSVTVKQPYTNIALNKSQLPLVEGKTEKLIATPTPGTPDDSIVWSSDKSDIATVDNNGTVKAVKAGTATITAASKLRPNDVKATCTVTVTRPVIHVTSVTLNKSSLTLFFGATDDTLKATIEPDNATNKAVNWTSSDPTVATVDSNGKVTATSKAGTTTITATSVDGSKSAACTVTVTSPVVLVTGVTVNPTTMTMYTGENKTITAEVAPDNAEDKSVTWKSSNDAVATVNASGVVVAHSAGTATITVTTKDGGHTATCAVTVKEKPVPVTSLTLDKSSFTLSFGERKTINVTTIKPDNATNRKINWSSSDPTVATVDSNGTVTAMSKAGTVTITAKPADGSNVRATCQVKVVRQYVAATGVKVEPSSLEIYLGQTKRLKATVLPEGTASDTTVVWSVQQGGVVAVNQNGVVTPLKADPYPTRVFVKTNDGGYTKSVQVTVLKNDVKSIELPVEKLVLKVGETYDLTVTVKGEVAGVPASNSNVTWKSGSTTIATVASLATGTDASRRTGRITALKAGKATITITSSDNSSVKETCEVTVLDGGSTGGGNEGVDFDNWDF